MTTWKEILPLSAGRSACSSAPVTGYPVSQLQHEVNRLFSDFFGDWRPFSEFHTQEGFVPSVNLEETPEQYIITCDVPGVDEKDIKIQLVEKGVVIRGEKKHHSEVKEGSRMIKFESSYGRFERSVYLDSAVKEDAIDAVLKAGQLRVVLPKQDSRKGEKVISVRKE